MVSAGLTLIFGMMGVLNHAHELLLTFGLAFIIEEVIKLFYGDALVSYQMPDYMRFAAFTIFDTNYPFYRLFMGAVALAMFAVLYLLLTRTRVGIVVRAATYRPTTVEALGHNLPLVYMAVFAGGSALAGLAGAVAGALAASLMIGLFISFSVGLNVSIADLLGLFGLGPWAQELGGLFTLQLSTVANSMPFMLMLLVLLIRPAGLMGDRQ